MDISYSINTTKNHNKDLKEMVEYFIKEYKKQKEEKNKIKLNFIDMDAYLKRK